MKIKNHYLKLWFLHFATFIGAGASLGLASAFFVLANQKWTLPKIANFAATKTIPFDALVNPKTLPKVKKVHSMNLSKNTISFKTKQKILKMIPVYAKLVKTEKTNVLNSSQRADFFTDSFASTKGFNYDLKKMLSEPYSSINDVIPTGLGADKSGSFVILDYIVQNDTPDLVNNQIKTYFIDTPQGIRFTKSESWGEPIKNKGGLSQLFSINNVNNVDDAYQAVQQLFSKLELSNVYQDRTNLDNSVKFKNLTNGMSAKSKQVLKKVILHSEGNFSNYGLSSYFITDVPNQIKLTIQVGGTAPVFFTAVYSAQTRQLTVYAD